VLSYTTSPAYHIIEEKKDNYAAANFAEGHYLQVEVAARTAASKQPELAEKFLKFMVSPASRTPSPPATGCIRSPGCAAGRFERW
jgi:thiamine transport system substrate-binding protein